MTLNVMFSFLNLKTQILDDEGNYDKLENDLNEKIDELAGRFFAIKVCEKNFFNYKIHLKALKH